MSKVQDDTAERPPNPFMGRAIATAKSTAHKPRRRAAVSPVLRDRALLDELPTAGERARFLRESGLELSDFGLENWIGGNSDDPDVQLHQAFLGSSRQSHGRAWAGYGATEYLSTKQFRKGYGAIALANYYGEVMSTFISISWSTVGVTEPEDVMKAQMRYLELLRKWLGHRDVPSAWVWVIENGKTYGLHSHILLRVPHRLKEQLAYQVETAVETIAGSPVKRKRRGMKGERTVHVIHRRDGNVNAQWRLFRYMMKGMKPTKRDRNPERRARQVIWQNVVGRRLQRQGLVVRQRLGVARSLNTSMAEFNQRNDELPPNAFERGEREPAMLFTDEYVRNWHASQQERYAAERRAKNERLEIELTGSLQI